MLQTILFSNSYYPRTGHNFASEVLKVFTDHKVLIHNRSETRLSNLLGKYDEIYSSIAHQTDRDFFRHVFLRSIRASILEKSNSRYVMIKNTSFEGAYTLPEIFPDDLHIILIRHPYDVFSSVFKAMKFKKKNLKTAIKKIGMMTGLYPYYYCKKISKRVIKNMPDFNLFYVLSYESLVKKENSILEELKEKFNTQKSLEQIKCEIDDIKVINSSYFEETGAKNIWESKERTKTFNPVNRRKHSFMIRKGIELGSRQLAKKLNYI